MKETKHFSYSYEEFHKEDFINQFGDVANNLVGLNYKYRIGYRIMKRNIHTDEIRIYRNLFSEKPIIL